MTKNEWAYFAGLFDGEGSVTISQVTRRTATVSCSAGTTVTNSSVRIANNNPVPLLELEQKFGGRVRPHGGQKKNHWVWICNGYFAVDFCKGILPYSRIKTGQIEIYIAFASFKRRKAMGRVSLTTDELSERRAMIQKLDKIRKQEGGKVGVRLVDASPV